jgi:hypothetical protein
MQLATFRPNARRTPPPLWLVTNGDVTVGPVNTEVLVRGVRHGKIRESCYVRDTRTQAWRPVTEVREVRALIEASTSTRSQELEGLETLMRLATEEEEAIHLALEVATRRTHAVAGLAHFFEDPMRPPVTRFARGETSPANLGARLLPDDPVTLLARNKRIAMGDVSSGKPFALTATRLWGDASDARGVAMVPIFGSRGIAGMLELGKTDHPFRTADAIILNEVARTVSSRLAVC